METIELVIFWSFWLFAGIIVVHTFLTEPLNDMIKYRWLRITIKVISLLLWPLTLICIMVAVIGFIISDLEVVKKFFE
jgi:hypothetical protein